MMLPACGQDLAGTLRAVTIVRLAPAWRGGGGMWFVRLYKALKEAKDLADVIGWLGLIGVPGATAVVAFVKGLPWDVVILYAMGALAFWVVIYVEGKPLFVEWLQRDPMLAVHDLWHDPQYSYHRLT